MSGAGVRRGGDGKTVAAGPTANGTERKGRAARGDEGTHTDGAGVNGERSGNCLVSGRGLPGRGALYGGTFWAGDAKSPDRTRMSDSVGDGESHTLERARERERVRGPRRVSRRQKS